MTSPDKMAARRKMNKRILIWIGIPAAILLLIGACGALVDDNDKKSTGSPEPTTAQAAPTMAPVSSDCRDADPALVDLINGGFIDQGEHLADAQMIIGRGARYIGGNIMAADGTKVSSQDTWAIADGGVGFAITSDARQRTAFVDGRHMPALEDWPEVNAAVGRCVGAVERSRNTTGG